MTAPEAKPQVISLAAPGVSIPSDLPMRQWLYAWLLDPKIAGNYQQSLGNKGKE